MLNETKECWIRFPAKSQSGSGSLEAQEALYAVILAYKVAMLFSRRKYVFQMLESGSSKLLPDHDHDAMVKKEKKTMSKKEFKLRFSTSGLCPTEIFYPLYFNLNVWRIIEFVLLSSI